MSRRGVGKEHQRAAMIRGGQQMIARRQRPAYRLRTGLDGEWLIEGAAWLAISAASRREAIAEARATIARLLEVDLDRFEIENVGSAQ